MVHFLAKVTPFLNLLVRVTGGGTWGGGQGVLQPFHFDINVGRQSLPKLRRRESQQLQIILRKPEQLYDQMRGLTNQQCF